MSAVMMDVSATLFLSSQCVCVCVCVNAYVAIPLISISAFTPSSITCTHWKSILTKNFSCLTANARPLYVISAWTFYLVAMLFDFLALSISTVYLLKKKPKAMPQS